MAEDAEMRDVDQVSQAKSFEWQAYGRRYLERHGWSEGQGVELPAVRERPRNMALGADMAPDRTYWPGYGSRQEIREQTPAQQRGDGVQGPGQQNAQQQQQQQQQQARLPPTEPNHVRRMIREQMSVDSDIRAGHDALQSNLTLNGIIPVRLGKWLMNNNPLLAIDHDQDVAYSVESQQLMHPSALVRGLPGLAQAERNSFFGAVSPVFYFRSTTTSLRRTHSTAVEGFWADHLERAEPLPLRASMADFSFSEDYELQKLNAQVLEEPEEFEHWEKLVRAAESQEGGLTRNSRPEAIAATRDVYDRFLARFPLFFGYWKKYADLEFSIVGTEAAEMVYERGVANIGISVDLWANYCGFKAETSHDYDVIRDLFERGADCVGLDFLAHPFWDRYLEFEERIDGPDRIFKLLERIIHIPMHAYARYFERYRTIAQNRPIPELAPENVILQLQQEIQRDGGMKQKGEPDIQRELRTRIDSFHVEIFKRTEAETMKRWTYEQEVKRPYYHVTDLDEAQMVNWRRYLDFEEAEGGYIRTKFLYERCLVTAANYDEFWFRYARWMLAQGKQDEVRNIYQRASCVFVPISRPLIRLHYAQYEESLGYPVIAADIHEAILMILPNHLETIISLTNLYRRQYGVDAAINLLKKHLDSSDTTTSTRGALISEWARILWEIVSSPDEARKVWRDHQQAYLNSQAFWLNWLFFEIKQPATGPKQQTEHYERVKSVYDAIRTQSLLPPGFIADMTSYYLVYLTERGGPDAMKEFMRLDQEVHGSRAAPQGMQDAMMDDEDTGTMHRRMILENGHASVAVGDSMVRTAGNSYTKHYAQQGGSPAQPVNGQAAGQVMTY